MKSAFLHPFTSPLRPRPLSLSLQQRTLQKTLLNESREEQDPAQRSHSSVIYRGRESPPETTCQTHSLSRNTTGKEKHAWYSISWI